MTTSSDQQKSADASISTFTSSLIFNAAISVAIFVTFDIKRKRSKKVYEPRTFLIPERNRSEPLPSGLFAWVLPVLRVNEEETIKRIGLDAYMFLRFMKMWMILFGIFSIFGLAVLLPVNSVNQKGSPGLEKFTIGNIENVGRLWTHVILTWLFSALVLYALYREMHTFIRLRHEYFTTDEYRNSSQATTILVTGIPNELNDSDHLKRLFDIFPGGVRRIWLNREPSKLAKVTAEREKVVTNLEVAATNYITQYSKDSTKLESGDTDAENGISDNIKRPQHRTLPIVGKKVDSLSTYRTNLNDLNQKISEMQKDLSVFKRLNSAFIQFNDYIGAQLAATSTVPKLNNISSKDVIWENLNLTSNQRMIRRVISLTIVVALVSLWAPLVTFVASIATLNELQKILPFLEGPIGKLPSSVVGIIQGILPPVALAILMFLLPIILGFLSRFEGIVTHSGVDVSVQGKYYFFLVVNVLLITSFANGVFSSLPEIIHDPTKAVEILATNLPRASTFFLTYVLLTITSCALEVSQIVPSIVYYIKKKLLAKSPRQIWDLKKTMPAYSWGTGFPQHIIIASIGLVYSTVQPLILPIVALHFALYYIVYRHQFLYVYEQPHQSGGLLFPKAIYQIFTAIYIYQLTLIGLMSLKKGYAQSILCIILLVISVGILLAMRLVFKHNPRAEFLPVDLMGVVDAKTRNLIVDQNTSNKLHETISPEKRHNQNDEDDYTNQEVVHIDEAGGEFDESDSFLHPALYALQPTVWIPNDQNISNDMVKEFKDDGIKTTNQGTSLDEKHKVQIDIDKVPLEFRDDIDSKRTKANKQEEVKGLKQKINEIEEEIGSPSS